MLPGELMETAVSELIEDGPDTPGSSVYHSRTFVLRFATYFVHLCAHFALHPACKGDAREA